MTDHERELRLVYWDLAIAWKLYDSAVRDARYNDANHYARCITAAEGRARRLLGLAAQGSA